MRRTSFGSKPDMMAGMWYASEKRLKGFIPIMVATCPGQMNPSIWRSPKPMRSSIAGGLVFVRL